MRLPLTIAFSILAATLAFAGATKKDKGGAAAPPPTPACANENALGIGRTVEIDTTGGPGFGLEQYKAYDFLEPKEVVLTFDDGPQVNTTEAVLAALSHHCTKATFFSIGKMAVGLPEIIRRVAAGGHTIGSHTWSHADLRAHSKKDPKEAISEIERGLSAVKRAVGVPIAPFFRFPFLRDSPETIAHLGSRNIAVFSMDADSFDFKIRDPDKIVKTVMDKLEKKGKGIVLMHDINPFTAKAVPKLLDELKAKGYRIVHMKAAAEATSLAEYDEFIEKDVRGLPGPGAGKATSSIVKTVPTGP